MPRRLPRSVPAAVVAVVAAAAVASGPSTAGAAPVGNDLIARPAGSDGATTVLQVYRSPSDVIPGPGVVKSFSTFNQSPGSGFNFNAYVLRPTGNANEYNVVFDSGPNAIDGAQAGFVATFQNAPVAVQAGDLIAHYRTGIPYADHPHAQGEDPQTIFFSSPNPPVQGNNIVLGSADFPNSGFNRTYSFAADFRAAGSGPVGNDLTYRRSFGSDGAADVLNVYHNSAVPEAGSLDTVSVRYQTSADPNLDSGGKSFQFVVLRPTGGDQYSVVYNSGTITQPVGAPDDSVQTFNLADQNGGDPGSVSVLAGDLIGHYGRGVPFTIVNAGGDLGAGTDNIYFPSPNAPAEGNTITLGVAPFPLFNQERDYALSANFTAIPEPAALSLAALGAVALLGRRKARP